MLRANGSIHMLITYPLYRYFPYDPSPEVLKKKTDAAFALLKKLQKIKVDTTKLKAREGKALSQVYCVHNRRTQKTVCKKTNPACETFAFFTPIISVRIYLTGSIPESIPGLCWMVLKFEYFVQCEY